MRLLFGLCLLGLLGCRPPEKPQTASTPATTIETAQTPEEAKLELRKQLAKAAGIPDWIFEKLETENTAELWAHINQDKVGNSLTWLIMNLSLERADATTRTDFDYLPSSDGAITFPKLVATLKQTKAEGFGSVLAAEFVKSFECRVEGNTATGEVRFEASERFRGRVTFVAKRVDGLWRYEEFLVPSHKLGVRRPESGGWRRFTPE